MRISHENQHSVHWYLMTSSLATLWPSFPQQPSPWGLPLSGSASKVIILPVASSFLPTFSQPPSIPHTFCQFCVDLAALAYPGPCYVTNHLPLFGKRHPTQQVATESGVNWNMCCAQVCNKKGLIDIRKIQPYVDVCLRIFVYMGNVVCNQAAFE